MGQNLRGSRGNGALGFLWDLLVDDLQPHSVLAPRLPVSSSLGPRGGKRGLFWNTGQPGLSADLQGSHISLGLSEEGEEPRWFPKDGGNGARCCLFPEGGGLHPGGPLSCCSLLPLASSTIQKLRECKSKILCWRECRQAWTLVPCRHGMLCTHDRLSRMVSAWVGFSGLARVVVHGCDGGVRPFRM